VVELRLLDGIAFGWIAELVPIPRNDHVVARPTGISQNAAVLLPFPVDQGYLINCVRVEEVPHTYACNTPLLDVPGALNQSAHLDFERGCEAFAGALPGGRRADL